MADLNVNDIEKYLNYFARLGGGGDVSLPQLICGVLNITKKYVINISRVVKWRADYLINNSGLSSFKTEENVLTVYRKFLHRLPTSYKTSLTLNVVSTGTEHLSTIQITPTIGDDTKPVNIAIYRWFDYTYVDFYSKNRIYYNYIRRILNCGDPINETIGGSTPIDTLLRLGIDVKSILTNKSQTALTVGDIKKWVDINPLTATMQVGDQPVYKSYKQLMHEDMIMNDFLYNQIDKLKQPAGFCIPSGHGKTTLCARLRRERLDIKVLDIDEIVEQAWVLACVTFDSKMAYYRSQLERHLNEGHKYDVILCHSPLALTENVRPNIIINKGAVVPIDRVWSKANVEHLINQDMKFNYTEVHSHEQLYKTIIDCIDGLRDNDITIEGKSLLIDNVDSLLGYDFMHNVPAYDDVLRLPINANDKLLLGDHPTGLGQQRVFVTGTHVDTMRPTLNKLPTALPNAITTRLMGRQALRTQKLTVEQYHKIMERFLIPNYQQLLTQFTDDQINLNYVDIMNWLVNKGNKLELLENHDHQSTQE